MSLVIIHWGDVVAYLLQLFQPVIAAAIIASLGWLAAKFLPPQWLQLLAQLRVNQLLKTAIGAGIAHTAGAMAGQKLEIDIANKVLDEALQYLDQRAPQLVKKYGPALEQMLIARLGEAGMLPPESSKANLGAAKAPLLQP
jgi:hypothetical protein